MRILNRGSLCKARQEEDRIPEVATAAQANEDRLAWKLRQTGPASDMSMRNIQEHCICSFPDGTQCKYEIRVPCRCFRKLKSVSFFNRIEVGRPLQSLWVH